MRPADVRRLEALEQRMGARRDGSGLQAEIEAMDSDERGQLRQFLEYAVKGGRPGDGQFDALMAAAEDAILAARERRSIGKDVYTE